MTLEVWKNPSDFWWGDERKTGEHQRGSVKNRAQLKVPATDSMLLFESDQGSRHSSLLFSLKPSGRDATRLVFSPPEETGCGVEPSLHPDTNPDGGFQRVITGAAAGTKASTWHCVWFCLGGHVEVAEPEPEPEPAAGRCKNTQQHVK